MVKCSKHRSSLDGTAHSPNSTSSSCYKAPWQEDSARSLVRDSTEERGAHSKCFSRGTFSLALCTQRMRSAQLPLQGEVALESECRWPILLEAPVQEGYRVTSSTAEWRKEHLTRGWGSAICLLCELGHITVPVWASVSCFIKLGGRFLSSKNAFLSQMKSYGETPRYRNTQVEQLWSKCICEVHGSAPTQATLPPCEETQDPRNSGKGIIRKLDQHLSNITSNRNFQLLLTMDLMTPL